MKGLIEFSATGNYAPECWRNTTQLNPGKYLASDRFTERLDPQGFILLGDIELHNRADLVESLGAPEFHTDSQLVLEAFSKWGDSCADHLLGEFSFAIWDEHRQRLYCCRDHAGQRPFLYHLNSSTFFFATDLLALFALPGVPRRLNASKLAGLGTPSAHHAVHEETFHQGILSLPGGSYLVLESGRIRIEQYWRPENARIWTPRRPDEAYEALRDLVFQAVECRLPRTGPAVTLLSGGLDSSAVTA